MAAAALRRIPRMIPFLKRSHHLLSTLSEVSSPPLLPSPSNPIARLKSAIHTESDPNTSPSSSSRLPPSLASMPNDLSSPSPSRTRPRRPDLVERLLDACLSDPAAPHSEGFLVRIISLYSAAAMPDHAACTFDRMPSLGVPRSDG